MGKVTLWKTTAHNAAALAIGLVIASYPARAAPASGEPLESAGAGVLSHLPQNHKTVDYNIITTHNDENSAAITFARPTGGITQISIESLDIFPNAYVTIVTASGPTRDDAALAAAILKIFTNLSEQASFVGTDSISFAYNQPKPSYVISELERAKLISPVEAHAARTAFYDLQSRTSPSLRQRGRGDNARSGNTF